MIILFLPMLVFAFVAFSAVALNPLSFDIWVYEYIIYTILWWYADDENVEWWCWWSFCFDK